MILGIDPGKNGALCFYYNDKDYNLYQMPPVFAINEMETIFANEQVPEKVYIEKAHAMPKQGVSSMFNYGMHYGWVLGYLPKQEFFDLARFFKKGDSDPSSPNNFNYRSDTYSVRIDQLKNINLLVT